MTPSTPPGGGRPKTRRVVVPFVEPQAPASPQAAVQGYEPQAIRAIDPQLEKWHEFARDQVKLLLSLFRFVTFAVVALIFFLVTFENVRDFLFARASLQPPGRIVTERVLLMLIAASAVQLGTIAVAMGRALSRLPDRG